MDPSQPKLLSFSIYPVYLSFLFHILSDSLSPNISFSISHSLSDSLSSHISFFLSHSLSDSISLYTYFSISHSLSHSLPLTLTYSIPYKRTHIHIHTHTLSLSSRQHFLPRSHCAPHNHNRVKVSTDVYSKVVYNIHSQLKEGVDNSLDALEGVFLVF